MCALAYSVLTCRPLRPSLRSPTRCVTWCHTCMKEKTTERCRGVQIQHFFHQKLPLSVLQSDSSHAEVFKNSKLHSRTTQYAKCNILQVKQVWPGLRGKALHMALWEAVPVSPGAEGQCPPCLWQGAVILCVTHKGNCAQSLLDKQPECINPPPGCWLHTGKTEAAHEMNVKCEITSKLQHTTGTYLALGFCFGS